MGGMTVNLFVRSDDQAAVADAAKAILGPGYTTDKHDRFSWAMPRGGPNLPVILVSPPVAGWVGVHDATMQSQDGDLCQQAAVELSARLQTTAITFLVHDGDFLVYWLAHNGALVDAYHSMPDYFEGVFVEDGDDEDAADEAEEDGADYEEEMSGPEGGNPQVLAECCGRPDQADALAAILTQPGFDGYDLLATLGEALGIPDPTVDYQLLIEEPRGQYVAVTREELK